MTESLIGQLAVLAFLLLSTFLGRWLSRLERSRRTASEVEDDVEATKSFESSPDEVGSKELQHPRSVEAWVHRGVFSAERPRDELLDEQVLVHSQEEHTAPMTTRDTEPPSRELPVTAFGRREPQASRQELRTVVPQPSDLRYAFRLALLLAPPRTLALDTEPDRDRIQP